jgi:hypothetical protein
MWLDYIHPDWDSLQAESVPVKTPVGRIQSRGDGYSVRVGGVRYPVAGYPLPVTRCIVAGSR